MFTSTQTVLVSEIVKHCVAPACRSWPGPTRRSTISPATGAITGISAGDRVGFLSTDSGSIKAESGRGVGGRFEVGTSLRVRGFCLLQISFGDGAVSVKVLGASEELVRKFVSVAGFF